jgi:hypothetical protein
MVSLVLAIIVVLVDGLLSFSHLWEVFIAASNARGFRESVLSPVHSPFGDLQSPKSSYSHQDIQIIYASASNLFNVLVAPALFATIIGISVFAWAEQSRMVAISITVVQGVLCLSIVAVASVFCNWAVLNRRQIREHNQTHRPKERMSH